MVRTRSTRIFNFIVSFLSVSLSHASMLFSAIVGVNTSPDYENPSGCLTVVSLTDRNIVSDIELGGQPDAVAVSKDETKIAVAIENERDEDLNDGDLPQYPAGFVVMFDVADPFDPLTWVKYEVVFAEEVDPEPEYVAFNSDGTKVIVTLQENNKIALIDSMTHSVGTYKIF